MLNCWCIT